MLEPINQFKGIISNISETNAEINFCRDTTCRINHLGLVSEGLRTVSLGKNTKGELYDGTVKFFKQIALDNDKNGIEYKDGEYESNYEFDLKYYYCIITESKVYLYSEKWNLEFSSDYIGAFKKAIYVDNILYLLTSLQTYELKKFNRTTNRKYITGVTVTSIFGFKINTTSYKEEGIKLIPLTYVRKNGGIGSDIYTNSYSEDLLAVEVNLERSNSAEVEYTITYSIGEEFIFPYFQVQEKKGYELNVITVNVFDSITKEKLTEMFFTNILVPTANRSYEVSTNYVLLPYGTTKKTLYKNYDKDGTEEWSSKGLESLGSHAKSKGEITELTKATTDKFKYVVPINEYNGFSSDLYETYYMGSFLMDDGSEIPVVEEKLENNTITDYYYYTVDLKIPYNLTTKVMSFRLYIKNNQQDPYEMIDEYSFYSNNAVKKVLTKYDMSGIFSPQTLGFADPFENQPLLTFEDGIFIDGILYFLKGRKCYYPVVGNGSITHSYYSSNVIPKIEGSKLININNNLGIVDKNRTTLIKPFYKDGLILFRVEDEIGFVINDEEDIVETPDGVIINTSTGIYSTNGNSLQLLSQNINDKIRANFLNSSIVYNETEKELYYIIADLEETYIYSFEFGVWTKTDYLNMKKGFSGEDRKFYALSDNDIASLEKFQKECTYQSLLTNFGLLGYYKFITHLNFDFQGTIIINGRTYESVTRSVKTINKGIYERIPVEYLDWNFVIKENTIVYGIEIHFDIVKKIETE